ncbi:hypothetical protein [Flavobacterium soli]|uniref:hypothetical protein n=1 Tax=Flavobacterium soli TaxID=344881 RepID=UPI00040B13B8|nr:hypothetical protein [Flavobacterium soli]
MNKYLYIVVLLFCFQVYGQDTLATAKKEVTTFTEKDIQIDSSNIEQLRFKPSFKEEYDSDDFVYEQKTKEENFWDRFKEWLARFFQRIFSISNNEAAMNTVDFVFKTIAVLVILFVVYLIVKAILSKEGKWVFGKNSDRKIINYDAVERNLHSVDFEKLIKQSIQAGEKRLSIRYYYLWLLKKMSEKQIIEWDAEKTNSDYLYEIKSETFKKEFGYLSYLYNYIWYGEFELDETTFEKARKAFEKSIQTIY